MARVRLTSYCVHKAINSNNFNSTTSRDRVNTIARMASSAHGQLLTHIDSEIIIKFADVFHIAHFYESAITQYHFETTYITDNFTLVFALRSALVCTCEVAYREL